MKEIGSFLELYLNKGAEYYTEAAYGVGNVARLNTGRAAILYSLRQYGVNKAYMPRYQCDTVIEMLQNAGVEIIFYDIDGHFVPRTGINDEDSAFVLVNYYGMFGTKWMSDAAKGRKNVIIDNAQAFFAHPIAGALNCYSTRKWVGVPDGAYVVGNHAASGMDALEQDYSSETASFLLERIEYGCEGRAYLARTKNEQRLNESPVRKMSRLTHAILDGFDYRTSAEKRLENFHFCRELFDGVNLIYMADYLDDDAVPYVYPLLVERDGIIEEMQRNKIFQGHWWEYLTEIAPKDSFEYKLSKYIVPVTIDYRYGKDDMLRQYDVILKALEGKQ